MTDCDMVTFHATGDGRVEDYWSVGHSKPQLDSSQDIQDVSVTQSGGKYIFTAFRKRDTGDSQDAKIEVGTDYPMIWGENTNNPEMSFHTAFGSFTIQIPKSSNT